MAQGDPGGQYQGRVGLPEANRHRNDVRCLFFGLGDRERAKRSWVKAGNVRFHAEGSDVRSSIALRLLRRTARGDGLRRLWPGAPATSLSATSFARMASSRLISTRPRSNCSPVSRLKPAEGICRGAPVIVRARNHASSGSCFLPDVGAPDDDPCLVTAIAAAIDPHMRYVLAGRRI